MSIKISPPAKLIHSTLEEELFVMNVHVNGNCIGCGLCVNMCGAVFLMTEEGVAAAKDTIYPDQEDFVQEAAESCPVNAIEVDP